MDCTKDIKVSVIIPLYNTEEFIAQTVQSIINQSLKEIEIIIINDGSTDNSLDIVSDLSVQDARIQVISQSNKGLSASRNTGINIAKGDYIYFMDSDDLLAQEALETCYNECMNRKLDFITFDAEPFISESNIKLPQILYDRSDSLEPQLTYEGMKALDIQVKNNSFTPSACLLLIKKTFLISKSLFFHEGIIHEDQLFTARAYLEAEAIGYIPLKYFARRFRSNSIMTSNFKWKNIIGYLTVFEEMIRLYQNDNQKYESVNRFLCQMMNAVIYNAHSLPLNERVRLLSVCTFTNLRNYVGIRSKVVLLLKKYIK